MEALCFYNSIRTILPFQKTVNFNNNSYDFLSISKPSIRFLSFSTSQTSTICRERIEGGEDAPLSAACDVLGVDPSCSPTELKAAFRAKVKQYHPDVNRNGNDSGSMIRRVIQAYEMLSSCGRTEFIERECVDPFENPECEAFDIFVNEFLCMGKGCPYSCVDRAPHAFTFASSTGTARATSQGHDEDYKVQTAVGQCPRNCIHYVTPLQRIILEELLESAFNVPYDNSAEADLLYSLIVKSKFENNRYKKPKRQPKASTERVDWY